MNYAAPALVQGQPRQGLPYGLFSVLSPRNDESNRWQNGIQWEPLTCEPVSGRAGAGCGPAEEVLGLPKNLEPNSGGVGDAAAFAVYGHYTCAPVGHEISEMQDLANAHLLSREEAFVEATLWDGRLGNTPNFKDDAETLTGSAVSPLLALAMIEDYIATHYGSLGVIHMTRGALIILSEFGVITSAGSKLVTSAGTPVVAGAGYPNTGPTGAAPSAGDFWIYGSPALFGYRSEIFYSSNLEGDLLDRANNVMHTIAERNYLLAYDPCGVGAAEFTSSGV